jgi:hypothetical protein
VAREDAAAKARRLLTEGRVTIARVDGREVAAIVRGDTAMTYRVWHRDGAWADDCPARTVSCSHIRAVQLVTQPVGWRPANDLLSTHDREPVAAWERTADPPVRYGERRRDACENDCGAG